MRFREISETVEQDIDSAAQAHAAAIAVMHALHDASARAVAEIDFSGTDLLLYDPLHCGLSGLDDLALMFGTRKQNTAGISGSCIHFNEAVMGRYHRAIVLYGLASLTEDAVRDFARSTGFLDVFQHEFIHLLDYARTDTRIAASYKGPTNGKAAYYNDASEFNAYSQDVAQNLTWAISQMRQESAGSRMEFLDLCGFTGSFAVDVRQIMQARDVHTSAFLKWLTADRRRALLKRLYRLHAEMMRVAREAPEQEPADAPA